MAIRKIAPKDFEGIRRLIYQVHQLHVLNRPDIFNDVEPFEKEYFEFLLQDENTLAIVYEDENTEIVAFSVVTLKQPSKNPLTKPRKVAYMEDLCVDETARKRGIGKLMYQEAQRLSKAAGAETMELMVWSFNKSAIGFYESIGMEPRSIIMEQKLS